MKSEDFEAGDVVMVWASLGGQTKLRPAIVMDQVDGSVQALLGTSKARIHGKNAVLVSSRSTMRRMGLSVPTVFEFTSRTFIWVPAGALESRAGVTNSETVRMLGEAWINAKFDKLI